MPRRDRIHEGTYVSQRVQHAHLETHGAVGWQERTGRLVIRSSTQVPFLTRDALCALFGLDRTQVRVVAARVGGGFGGKQEMLTEDLVALAVLRTGPPGEVGVHAARSSSPPPPPATRCGCG